jgi:hypothetical protein
MTTSILPTTAEQTIARIDSVLAAAISRNAAAITSIEKILTGTQGVTQDAIIAAGGDRYASLLAYIAALKAAANIAVPGSYPAPVVDTPTPA